MESKNLKHEDSDIERQEITANTDVNKNGKAKAVPESKLLEYLNENGKLQDKDIMGKNSIWTSTNSFQQTEECSTVTAGERETSNNSNSFGQMMVSCLGCKDRKATIVGILKVVILLAFFVYVGIAVYHRFGDEGSWRLLICSVLGVLLILWFKLKKTSAFTDFIKLTRGLYKSYKTGNRSRITRWVLYVGMTIFAVVYVGLEASKNSRNLRSLMGLVAFPVLLLLYSNNRRKINWHTVYWGMSLQFIMALLVLKTTWGAYTIQWIGDRLEEYISYTKAGSVFAFGEGYMEHQFVFGTLPQILAMSVGISVLNHLGVIGFIVETVGRALAFFLHITPPEGINIVGNVFMFVTESLLVIQNYVSEMTPSNLFMAYAGGFATEGGVVLVIFMSVGVPAAPLVAASAMSAPAAVAAAKITFPSTEDEVVPEPEKIPRHQTNILRKTTSILDSIIAGINQGSSIICQALFFVMTIVIIVEFANKTFIWFGDRIGVENMSMEYLMQYIFYPFAFLLGIREEDCLIVSRHLGLRTLAGSVLTVTSFGKILKNGEEFRAYMAESSNNTWSQAGNDIFLTNTNRTLIGGVIDKRSELIATFALCGAASLEAIGLALGAFEAMFPNRMQEVMRHIWRALVVGTFASYLTACFAGLLYEESLVKF